MAKQENRNTLSTSVLVRRFLPYFRKYRKTMAFDLCCAALTTVCELVLPPEKSIPIILDDALTNFDDERCAAALRWLKQAAAHRQILLFTCHSREADFFARDPEVAVQRL